MASPPLGSNEFSVDVVIVGGGASGTTAAIQAARMGIRVLIIEETPWLGGMLTSAGVPALDGNDAIKSGLHREFVEALWAHCGGEEAVQTGWVSKTLFEPSVGQQVLRRLAEAQPTLFLWMETRVKAVRRLSGDRFEVEAEDGGLASAALLIEATEFGDLLALMDIPHRFGRESREETGESSAPLKADTIVQDYTYCMILRDYGTEGGKPIGAPPGYDPENYHGSIRELTRDPEQRQHTVHTWERMITYGRLPSNTYMINWPIHGNDYFAPEVVSGPPAGRAEIYRRMKDHALGFLHYIQTVAGHPELDLAEGEFPTPDNLPFYPYIRESRRAEASVMLHLNDVVDRYANPDRPLYKTGVAVGDYFIDHHHTTNLDADPMRPTENFPEIQAVTVPLGCLIPKGVDGVIVAEKCIGVTHSVNGVTRLQPIVMNIGQAAGALAAVAVQQGIQPRDVRIRDVQQSLLHAGALLMPLADVDARHPAFESIHRVCVAGVMRPFDEPRRCEFRPNQPVTRTEAAMALALATGKESLEQLCVKLAGEGDVTQHDLLVTIQEVTGKQDQHFLDHNSTDVITREHLALLIDRAFDPFWNLPL